MKFIEKIWQGMDGLAKRPVLSVLFILLFSFIGSAAFGLSQGLFVFEGHDEYSFLLTGETLARGRLSNPTPPFWEHFESFHILVKPTYASGYPPMQGIFIALGILAGHPILGIWLSVGLMCAAIYWMLRAWLSVRWALVGGIWTVLHLGIYTYWSQRYWGGAPAAIGGALLLGAAKRMIPNPKPSHAVVMVLGLGMLANSRPFEGLITAVIASPLFFGGRSSPLIRRRIRRSLVADNLRISARGGSAFGGKLEIATAAVGSLAMTKVVKTTVSFLLTFGIVAILTGIYNKAVTGNPLVIPPAAAAQSESSVPVFVWQPLRPEIAYHHQVFRDFEETFAKAFYLERRTLTGFIATIFNAVENYWSFYIGGWGVFVLGLALPRLWKLRWPRWSLAMLLLFLAVTVLPLAIKPQRHYLAPLTGIVMLLFAYSLRCFYPLKVKGIPVGKILVLIFLAAAAIPRGETRMPYISPYAEQKAGLLKAFETSGGEHLILVRYGPHHYPHNEWVYNSADIDSQQVIWARSMGAKKDKKLMGYYKGRNVWLLTVDDDEAPQFQSYRVNPEFAYFVPPF